MTTMTNKDGRHIHVGTHGGVTLAYRDCPCWITRGYSRFALTPIPGPADEAYAAAVVRLRLSGLWFDDDVPSVASHDDDVREGQW